IPLVEREIPSRVADDVTEHRGVPFELADVRARIRIEDPLIGGEAMHFLRCVRAMHTVPVDLAWAYVRKVAMPDFIPIFGQGNAFDLVPAALVKQAKRD